MKIDIDFELLQQTGMSADDFTYLLITYRKAFNYLNNLNLKPNLDKLEKDGYIKIGETPDTHVIRQEFIDLFISDFDSMFVSSTSLAKSFESGESISSDISSDIIFQPLE